jgi:hypothetical protein
MPNVNFPVQIQADKENARESTCAAMCHVFDMKSFIIVREALARKYEEGQVVAWDVDANEIFCYDNRS